MINLSGLKMYFNGEFIPVERGGISPFDRGFLYGDAVYEGIREYNGKIFKLDEHLDRLFDSLKILNIRIPYNKDEIKNAVEGIYKVDVLSVNIIKIPAKKRRLGRTEGFRRAYRKAVVKIKEGQKIEIL